MFLMLNYRISFLLQEKAKNICNPLQQAALQKRIAYPAGRIPMGPWTLKKLAGGW